jgi:hypothetical protein
MGGIEFAEIDHGWYFEGVVWTVRHDARRGLTDGRTYADVTRREVLRSRRGFRDKPAVFDQRRPSVEPCERRIHSRDGLTRHDKVIMREFLGEIGNGILEWQRVRGLIDSDP